MTEVRGSVTDRPWGLTLGAIAGRRFTGQLTIESDAKRYALAFDQGAIVAAASPLAADAVARIALTNHLITSTQVPELMRRLALSPDRDEVEVVADAIQFSPDQVSKLRHRVLAQRAARTFSLERGEFVLDEAISLPVVAGAAIDHRLAIYLGARTNLSEQRLADDLRQLGSQFVLKPEAMADLPRYGFESAAQPVLDALVNGTSLPELEATHRELDPRAAQAVIYALVSCNACVIVPRSSPGLSRLAAAAAAPEAAAPRTNTRPMKPAALRHRAEATEPPPRSRTQTPVPLPAPAPIAAAPSAVAPLTTVPLATEEHPAVASPAIAPPSPAPVPADRVALATPPTGVSTGTPPPFAAGTETFPAPPAPGSALARARGTQTTAPPPSAARTTTAPATARTASSPFAARTFTGSSTSYSGGAAPDVGTNTPAAVRGKSQSEPPANARTPSQPRLPTQANPALARTQTPPAASSAARTTTTRAQPPEPAPSASRTDTEETVKFPDTPTPLPAAAKQSTVTFGESSRPSTPMIPTTRPSSPALPATGKPSVSRTPTGEADSRGFAEQRTPGFAEQQRTPGFAEQRTPSDQRTPTGANAALGGVATPRVSTDNAAAAEIAFKRGELAMKRDQPGEAVVEFKTAFDLNPNEVDYAGMLAWAKFCAAGDKLPIANDTRKALERAIFKSQRPERARFYLGRVERMLGRDKEALRHFQEVLEIKPNHAEAASEVRAIEARAGKGRKR